MAATVISSEAVVLSGGSATVTVPSDCTKALCQWTFFNATDAQGLATATLNSAAYDTASELPTMGGETATGVIQWNNPATGSRTLAMTFDAATTEGPTIFVTYLKDAAATWRDVDHDQGNATTAVTVTLTTVSGDLVVKHHQRFGTAPSATGGSWTSHQTQTNGGEGARVESIVATGSTQVCDANDENYGTVSAVAFESSASQDQDGFAFGSDDGSESAHTLNSEDTNLTAALGVKTLRVQVDATGNPASTAYTLRSQKNGAGGYVAVPLVSSGPGTTPLIEAGDCTVSGSNTTQATWAVSHPAAATGDLLIFNVAWDDSVNVTSVTAPTGPNGETLTSIEGPIASNGTEVRCQSWYTVATGTWTASTRTFTPATSESWSATVIKVPAGEFDASTPIGATSSVASAGTAETEVDSPAFSAGASDGGGRLVWFAAVDTDPLSGTNPTGCTILQTQDLGAVAHGVAIRNAAVTDSESIAAITDWAIAGDSWCSIAYVVRAPVVTNQVYVSASANVAAGGEATTARLTAPSGKTTSNFTTGRRWDDENGTDSIDIADAFYTEVEWVLTTQSPATTDDYFDFRVYAGAVALDAYAFTPRWTIGTGAQQKSVSGTLTSAGGLVKETRRSLSGGMASAGGLVKQAQRALSGAIASAGTLAGLKIALKALDGSIAMAGGLVKETRRTLTGSIGSAGTLAKQVQRALSGAIASAGTLVKQTRRAVSGAIASAGALNGIKTALMAVGGTLTMAGGLAKQTQRTLLASIASAGSLTKQLPVLLTGTLASAGGLVKQTRRALAGAISSVGTVVGNRAFVKAVAGAIAMSGSLAKQAGKALGGALSSAGTLSRRTNHNLEGVLTAVGSLVKQTRRALASALSFIGTLQHQLPTLASIIGHRSVGAAQKSSALGAAQKTSANAAAAQTIKGTAEAATED